MGRIGYALVAAFFAAGCGQSKDLADAGERAEIDDSESPGAMGRLALGFGAMGSILGDAGEDAPYEEPRRSEDFDASEAHFAVLELSRPVVELSSLSLFGASGVELREVLDTLRGLSETERVQGLLVRVSEPQLSLPAAEELRDALIEFKRRGDRERPIFCHTERASPVAYYVLTACDHLGLAPLGQVAIPGVSATPIHIRGLLDKIGVRAQFLAIGDHKTAAEPITRERPSRELVAALDDVLETRYRTLVRAIAEGRGLAPAAVRELIDGAIYQGGHAERAGLVDSVAPFSAYREARLEGAPWRREPLDGDGLEPDLDELMRLLGFAPRPRPAGERVAVVYTVGAVVEGEGRAGLRDEVAARPLVAALRVLADDDAVKAVVLRIDSPGGSALAADQIWGALRELAESKPLVVSMGSMAASGGYYIASAADTIYALENTLTGSIGVVGGKLIIEEGLGKLGIAAHPMGRGERALLDSPLRPWDADELALIEGLMQTTYERFVDRVATGRGMPRGDVEQVAGGRLWTGAAALEHGLVDRVGGLDAALTEARERGGVDAAAPIEVYPPEPSLLDLFGGMSGVGSRGVRGDVRAELRARAGGALLRALSPREAAVALSLFELALSLHDAPITATAFAAAALR